ncbi:MAG TPA: hypothetical protein VN605_07310 [Thermoanaerobaculia bacterium]|nr:hypothetical protein [Thermoanaerobaculia bacterium]
MNRLLALTASLFLLTREAAAVERVLVFDDVKKTDLQANFQSDCVATQPPANFQQLQRVPTKANAFFLYFDPTLIEPARFGKFFDYTFYVAAAGANPPVWYTCGTQVYTQGAFLDRSETAHFTVQVGSTIDDGALDVPLHSIASRDFIEVTSVTKPAKVDLSQSAGIELSLRNLLPDQDLLVDTSVQATASHPGYWVSTANVKLQDALGKDVIRIQPGDSSFVRLQLEPKKLPTLLATLGSVKPDAVHENVTAVLSYRSDLGGVLRTKPANIVVRFAPSLVSLIFALFAGSLLGTIAAQFLPGTWKGFYAMGQRGARGIVFSVVAELFAMLLVALGSKFVILNFDLDPWQFLPVFFIGFAISGGKEVLSYIGLVKQQNAAAENA